MLLLGLSRWGFRKVEYIIIAMVSVIGLAYVYETALVSPNWSQVGLHLVIPQVTSASILTAVSIRAQPLCPTTFSCIPSFPLSVSVARKLLYKSSGRSCAWQR